ncbi:MAG: hypothetical protein KUG77_07480 [Nannocystaceae bacterium]|nr:hypothetical protein [Nannocystaceae bacterium]
MSVSFNPRRVVTMRCFALFLLSLLTGCTVVRAIGYSNYRLTRDQATRLDAAEDLAKAFRDDRHRACLHWRGVAATIDPDESRGPRGFEEYADERVSRACSHEERLAAAQAAIRNADQHPHDREAQALALTRVDAFAAAQRAATASSENLTLRDLLIEVKPVVARLENGQTACADLLLVTNLLWTVGARNDALARYLGPQRQCLGAAQAERVAAVLRTEDRCDEVVALAAEVWPRMAVRDDQVLILDLVMACSDEYTMRRNFAFVPADILFDYQALRSRRAADEAEAQWQRELARQAERCEASCLSIYGETGACTSSCRGDTICVQSCRKLGDACWNSCAL